MLRKEEKRMKKKTAYKKISVFVAHKTMAHWVEKNEFLRTKASIQTCEHAL